MIGGRYVHRRRAFLKRAATAVGGAAVVVAGGVNAAETINVPEDYDTIEAAVNAASDGDRIEVAEGTYETRTLHIGKAITLVGDPGNEDTGPGDNAPIVVPMNPGHKAGVELAGPHGSPGTGTRVSGFEFRDFEWRAIGGGNGADDIVVSDNRFTDLGRGVTTFGDGREHVNWTIRRNEIENTHQGISLTNTRSTIVEENQITGEGSAGIKVSPDGSDFQIGVKDVTIADNRITGPDYGVYLLARNDADPSETVELQDVVVRNNVVSGAAEIGYRFSVGGSFDTGVSTRDVVYEGNVATDSKLGFRLDTQIDDGVSRVTYRRNEVRDVEVGLRIACEGADADTVPASDVMLASNTIEDTGFIGIDILPRVGTISDVTVHDNRVTDVPNGLVLRPEADGKLESVDATENRIAYSGSGVRTIGTGEAEFKNVELLRNEIVDNEVVGVHMIGVAPEVTLRENVIAGNAKWGAYNDDDRLLDAVENYWGAPNGPERPLPGGGSNRTRGEAGLPDELPEPNERRKTVGDGDRVSEGIDVTPWLSQKP